jgi:hypothetical protein
MSDYTVRKIRDEDVEKIDCSTLVDVSNTIHSSIRSLEQSDLPDTRVTFEVIFNHKKFDEHRPTTISSRGEMRLACTCGDLNCASLDGHKS